MDAFADAPLDVPVADATLDAPGDAAGDAGLDAGGDAGPDAGPIRGHIDHLVIIVLENHTFDSLFAGLPDADTQSHFVTASGEFDAPEAPDILTRDLCHTHDCALTAWNGGTNDGWESVPDANNGGDHLAWAQYGPSSIPGFWDLATSYAVADNYFSSMLGPSFPGHTFLLAAQAGWAIGNPGLITDPLWGCDEIFTAHVDVLRDGTCAVDSPRPCFDIPSAPDTLRPGVTWKFYGTGLDLPVVGPIVWGMFDAIDPIRHGPGWSNIVPYSQFSSDLSSGDFPNVAWLVDQDLSSGHPPLSMCSSVTWTTRFVNEVMASPIWDTTAILITYDDYGGFHDHVAPPMQYGCDATHPYGLGFRLPLIIVSPWVKQGVFHELSEQASVVRLIEELFGDADAVGSLHAASPAARDDVAGSLLPAFDFRQEPLPAVPARESCP